MANDFGASHLGQVLLARAEGRRQQGDYEGAREYYMRALARFGDGQGLGKVAEIFLGLSDVERNLGERDKARLYLQRAITAFERIEDKVKLADALNHLGLLEREESNEDAALASYEKSLQLRREAGDDQGRAVTLMNLGALHRGRGDRAAALACYREAADLDELASRPEVATLVYQALRQLADETGDDTTLFDAFAKDRAAREAAGDDEGLAVLAMTCGEALAARGMQLPAARAFEEAARLRRGSEDGAALVRSQVARALALAGAAIASADANEEDDAGAHARGAREAVESLEVDDELGAATKSDIAIARLAAAVAHSPPSTESDDEAASSASLEKLADAAIAIAEKAKSAERRGAALRLRGRIRTAAGNREGTGEDLRRALDAFERLEDLATQSRKGDPKGRGRDKSQETSKDGEDSGGDDGSVRRHLPRTLAARVTGGLPATLLDYGAHLAATGNVRAGIAYLERAIAATDPAAADAEGEGEDAETSPAPFAALRNLARLEHARAVRRSGQHERAVAELKAALDEVDAAIARPLAAPFTDGDDPTLAGVRRTIAAELDEAVAYAREPSEEARERIAHVERTAAEIKKLSPDDLHREILGLRKIQAVTHALAGELDIKRLLDLVVDCAIEVSRAERGFLIMTDHEGRPGFRAARRFEGFDLDEPAFNISSTIAGEVLRSGESIILADASREERYASTMSVAGLGLRSVGVLPLKLRGRVRGVLYLDHRQTPNLLDGPVVKLLDSIADHAAIAVDAATRHLAVRDESDMLIRRARSLEVEVATQSAELSGLRDRVRTQQDALESKYNYDRIIGKSPKMREVFRLLDRVVESDIPVMVYGESGTGKELVARAIHYNSRRKDGPFVSENFAALSDSVLESELFGHVKGAFTGAREDRKGIFETADTGTLFIDEVGDISDKVQKELLRVIQEDEVRPVGADAVVKVDVRIIAATNKDLSTMIGEQTFRDDLYYRLNVIAIKLPSLRERREDIPLLVDSFLADITETGNAQAATMFSPEGMRLLVRHHWPGNVRELRNVVERAALLAKGSEIEPEDIELEQVRGSAADEDDVFYKPYSDAKEVFAARYLRRLLERTQGNISSAARESGMLRQAFQRLMKRFNVRADDLRS